MRHHNLILVLTLLFVGVLQAGAGHRNHGSNGAWGKPPDYRTMEFRGRQVLLFGDTSNPPVLVLHEAPGLTRECMRLAEEISTNGFAVYVPLLFGKPGKSAFVANFFRSAAAGWRPLAANKSPKAVGELRAFSDYLGRAHRGQSIGVIGMCYTGTVPLALLTENTAIRRIVICQPARPGFTPGKARRKALGLSPEHVKAAAVLAEAHDIRTLGFRFATDKLSPRERFGSIAKLLGEERFKDRTIHTNEMSIPKGAHSVLTGDYSGTDGHPTRIRRDEMIQVFRERLHHEP